MTSPAQGKLYGKLYALSALAGAFALTLSSVSLTQVHAAEVAKSTKKASHSKASSKKNDEVRTAKATLINATGEKVGTATFVDTKDGVRVSLEAQKLSPGLHGIHFHEKGKCEGPDFKSSGGHFNPEKKSHGMKNPKGHHLGDLPNLRVESSGDVKTEFLAPGVNLKKDDPHSLLRGDGTSLMIHEKEDDLASDPAGNAGARVACGVIKATQAD